MFSGLSISVSHSCTIFFRRPIIITVYTQQGQKDTASNWLPTTRKLILGSPPTHRW
jgi:hypothetical protein